MKASTIRQVNAAALFICAAWFWGFVTTLAAAVVDTLIEDALPWLAPKPAIILPAPSAPEPKVIPL